MGEAIDVSLLKPAVLAPNGRRAAATWLGHVVATPKLTGAELPSGYRWRIAAGLFLSLIFSSTILKIENQLIAIIGIWADNDGHEVIRKRRKIFSPKN